VADVTRVSAVLRGAGAARGLGGMCILEIWTELSTQGRRFTRCRITDDPPELPDGAYEVEFAGHRIVTNKWGGQWELAFLWPQTVSNLADDLRGRDAA
jgi:hypothetical protein